MDKNQLLDYYSKHYLSKQEILFKLPFSISADSFWQELVNKRKMSAAILPLSNAQGKPYWYIMTDKMIKASEILCGEAMKKDNFDPYRIEMTTAMTWEMFFTSYVEGVQMDMDEALDYLSRDTEPSSVQEQILWNNRRAISTMVNNIFRPVNEDFILHLAYLLTQDMDSTAESYRQIDAHPIAAMSDNEYTIPMARDIPIKMNELYSFLEKNDFHPLIKAAVSQAFILAIRPFPDGNERLSRLLSTLILYRSGYDYFMDISISRKIAKESYSYYKNMSELLRQGNDADMTGFVEYYIDLLARSLTETKEENEQKEKLKTENTITQEQQMATVPLSIPQPKNDAVDEVMEISDILDGTETVSFQNDETATAETVYENPDFWNIVEGFCKCGKAGAMNMGGTIKSLIKQGISHFTVEQWSEYASVDIKKARDNCSYMHKKGLLENCGQHLKADYYFCVKSLQTKESSGKILTDEIDAEIKNKLINLQNSAKEKDKRLAENVFKLIQSEQLSFKRKEWEEVSGASPAKSDRDILDLIFLGIVYKTSNGNKNTYHIGKPTSDAVQVSLSKTQCKIYNILKEKFPNGFINIEAAHLLNLQPNSLAYHLNIMLRCGAAEIIKNTHPIKYKITASDKNIIPILSSTGGYEPQASISAAGAESSVTWA